MLSVLTPSVVLGAKLAPFPGFIEPCHPTLRQEALSDQVPELRHGIASRRIDEELDFDQLCHVQSLVIGQKVALARGC